MRQDTDPKMKDTNKIGLGMVYQAEITNYIKISIDFKQNLHKSYTVVWKFCNKQLKNLIKMNK